MAKFIRNRERKCNVEHNLEFRYKDGSGAGFSFECDENGKVLVEQLQECARENYFDCIDGKLDVECYGVKKYENNYTEHAIIECNHCKRHVILDGFTNTCECGTDYNFAGSELAPRSQWGEETGECF